MAFLSGVVKQIPIALTTDDQQGDADETGQRGDEPGDVGRPDGVGRRDKRRATDDAGRPAGRVGTEQRPDVDEDGQQHHPYSNNTTLYVRGHLLNDNIGGPGLDYNMVPITGKPAKNVGANDANGEHLHAIEVAAKDMWTAVRLGKALTATYKVTAQYGRGSRAETTTVRAASGSSGPTSRRPGW